MSRFTVFGFVGGLVVALVAAAIGRSAEETPQLASPEPQHEWLQQLVGEWEAEVEMSMDPSQPPVKSKGTETVRALGGFWTVAENRLDFFEGTPFTGLLTLGFDSEKQKYVGTWIDSMSNYLWTYEGTVDEGGTTLTLETVGPYPASPGQLVRFKEVLEIKDPDHKVFTSSVQGEDGEWTTPMTIHYRRIK